MGGSRKNESFHPTIHWSSNFHRNRTYPYSFIRRPDFEGSNEPGDLLDAPISILPDGAYALLFLVHQDLFESPEDEFVCSRAYGASRVAVVSMARNNPSLDYQQEERDHAWPDVVQQRQGQLLRPGRN